MKESLARIQIVSDDRIIGCPKVKSWNKVDTFFQDFLQRVVAGADGSSREQTIETSIRKKPPEGD
jgi:hypothetical protein